MTSTATDTGSAATAEVLAVLRGHKADREAVDVAMAQATIEWAILNEADPAACVGFFADKALPVAGVGAPLVSEFALMEYAAALGVTTESGFAQVGGILELRYRLPKLWGKVVEGRLPLWRARRIAAHTTSLPMAGAAQVDRHLAPVAHSCSWAQLDRTVEEAMVRFDPEAAEAKRREAAEKRHVDVHADEVSFDGTVRIDAEVDLADALDLEDALRLGAKQQADLGSTESLDVRRAKALGDLARRQLAFGFEGAEPGRAVDLVVHISEDALTGTETVGRCGNTRSPISVEQIREWCAGRERDRETGRRPGRPHPRRGLRGTRTGSRTRTPGRRALRVPALHQTRARDATPTTSSRTRKARPSSTNTAPLCRRHHRAKTHSPWDYSVIDRGTYLWTTPNGLRLIRDHRGTSTLPGEP